MVISIVLYSLDVPLILLYVLHVIPPFFIIPFFVTINYFIPLFPSLYHSNILQALTFYITLIFVPVIYALIILTLSLARYIYSISAGKFVDCIFSPLIYIPRTSLSFNFYISITIIFIIFFFYVQLITILIIFFQHPLSFCTQ